MKIELDFKPISELNLQPSTFDYKCLVLDKEYGLHQAIIEKYSDGYVIISANFKSEDSTLFEVTHFAEIPEELK